MNPLSSIRTIPFGNPTMIYHNKMKKFFINNQEVPEFDIQCWGEFGMKCTTSGSIIQFVIDNLPENMALVCYGADYNFELPCSLVCSFDKIVQLNRYIGCKDSLVIPGDDRFFESPEFYLPTNPPSFDDRINEVFWRGSCTGERRKDVVLALNNIPSCNVKLVGGGSHESPYWKSMPFSCYSGRCAPHEYSNYKIWLSIEGWGCASDTSRALMSGSAVIYFRKTKPWFDMFLRHEENCIIIEDNIQELVHYARKLLTDTEYTKRISIAGKELANRIFEPAVYKQFILNQLQ